MIKGLEPKTSLICKQTHFSRPRNFHYSSKLIQRISYPALNRVLDNNRTQIETLCKADQPPNWASLVEPLETLAEHIERVWSPVSHLNGVKDSDALRVQVEKALPLLSAYTTELGQNKGLYKKLKALANSSEFESLDQAQRITIKNELRDFELSGVALKGKAKARFKKINAKLAKLSHQYEQNVLDATEAWVLDIETAQDLAGLPEQVINAAQQNASEDGAKGWRFTLQAPSYIPFMTYAANRQLRQQMYEAYVTRASDQGPNAGRWDNSKIMRKILRLRQQKAALLGLDNFAEYSLKTKMAQSVNEVEQFLLYLAKQSQKVAEQEWQQLQDFARKLDGLKKLEAWDLAYYSELLKKKTFDFSDEDLRPYFPLDTVIDGLFEVVERVFEMRVVPAERPQVWHEDVQFFAIEDVKGERRGWFYLDLYARKGKRGGAWMADCTNRRKTGEHLQLPIAFLDL